MALVAIGLKRKILDCDRDKDEEFYAARIGRTMWRVAKRRALEMRRRPIVTAENAAVSEAMASDNKAVSPVPNHDPAKTATTDPSTLAEFLQALAAELAGDDQDPGDS